MEEPCTSTAENAEKPDEEEKPPRDIMSNFRAHTHELLVRLEEFETLINSVREDASDTQKNLAFVGGKKDEFYQLCKKIDELERFIELIDENVNKVEHHVAVASEELGISDNRVSSLLKNVFIRSRKKQETNLDESGNYIPVELMKISEYFIPPTDPPKLEDVEAELAIELGELSEEFLS